MGRWRFPYDGSRAGALARNFERDFTERLFHRLSARCACGTFSSAGLGMAPDVLDWRIARAARALHPHEGSGVGSLEAKSCRQHGASPAHSDAQLETLSLSA